LLAKYLNSSSNGLIEKCAVFIIFAPLIVASSSPKALSTTTEQIAVHGPMFLFVTAVLVAPIIETIVAQWLPIEALLRLTKSVVSINLGSTLLFSLLHLEEGLINALSMIPIGIILAGTFLRFKRQGPWYSSSLLSIVVTTFLHALHNGIAVALYLYFVMS